MPDDGTLLYRNFLRDPREYVLLENWWRRLADNILTARGERQWEPWFSHCYLNGKPFRDGNPIFSAVSPDGARAVRIIQVGIEELGTDGDESRLSAELLQHPQTRDKLKEELVIRCVLYREDVATIRELLEYWMSGQSASKVQMYIKKHGLMFE